MHADTPARARKIKRNRPAEPSPRASHERGCGILVFSHVR
jgi:hypothetical protein